MMDIQASSALTPLAFSNPVNTPTKIQAPASNTIRDDSLVTYWLFYLKQMRGALNRWCNTTINPTRRNKQLFLLCLRAVLLFFNMSPHILAEGRWLQES